MILHTPKDRTVVQLGLRDSRTRDSESNASQHPRIVPISACLKNTKERFRVPLPPRRFDFLNRPLRLTPCAVTASIALPWQHVAEMLRKRLAVALTPCNQINDLLHSLQILLLSIDQVFVQVINDLLLLGLLLRQLLEHTKDVDNSCYLKVDQALIMPCIQFRDDVCARQPTLSCCGIDVDVGVLLRFLAGIVDRLGSWRSVADSRL